MISSMLAPDSKFSKTVETGIRVPLNTHAPLTLPGMLSTAGHWDQSRIATLLAYYAFPQSLQKQQVKGATQQELWPILTAGDPVRHFVLFRSNAIAN